MGTQEPSSNHPFDETLDVFTQAGRRGTPLTTSEVADALDCTRRTAYGKLEELADHGELETKEVGARGRVWWRPIGRSRTVQHAGDALDQAQFRELVQTVSDYAIFVLDREGRIRTWNDGAKRLKGYDEDAIVGEHFSVFYTEEDRERGRPDRNLEEATEHGRVEDEGWRVREDGSTFWANVTITSIRDDDGDLQGFIKITRDMTERNEYEERLREQKERFEALVREVKDYAIFLLDPDGIVRTWNDGAKRLKGYDEDAIVGEHFSVFYTEEDRERGRPDRNLSTAVEEGRLRDEGWRVHEDGSTFWANVTITTLYDDEGDVRGFAKVTYDMTERHMYEERLREQRDELDELNRINAIIRDIDQALVEATSREEIEQAVCDRLASSDTYSAAWIAEYADDYGEITPRTWAGISDEYLDAIRAADAETAKGTEKGAGATALRTRTIQPIQRLQIDLASEPWQESSLGEGYASAITVPLVYDEVEYGVLMVYTDHESAFDRRKTAVMSELGETISHAIAAIRRTQRERTLTTLQRSTRELLHAETRSEIGDIIVETLTGDLALADAVVYCFDTTGNTLDPVSSSFQTGSHMDRLAPLTAETDSPVWTSFMEGETRFAESALPPGETDSRRTMLIPLDDHGVLAVAATDREAFDGKTRQLVNLVAATAEAAFDRVESQANLRERDELLQEQNKRLQRLNQVNTIIREVDQGLVQATTRDEAQRVVCDRLAKSDHFGFAWIGTPDDVDEGLTPRAWSGDGQGYLDELELPPRSGKEEAEPAVIASETGDITVVSNVAADLRSGQWRKEAFSRGFQSVISVPLSYGDVTYGVLTVYADHPKAFEEMEQSVFAELGKTITNAIDAIDTKQRLLSDRVIELEFRFRDSASGFLGRLALQIGCEISFEGVIPLSKDRARVFFVARDISPDELRDVLERSVVVESSRLIATSDEGHLVETVVSGSTIALFLVEHGSSPRTLTVTEEDIRLVTDLPSSVDVRGFIERFRTRYESAEFVARRERERSVRTREGFYAKLEDSLTDRQLEVLKTAYYSGFFASPRRSTGGDIAELLDVSQPTVTEHLRTAQRKVLDLLFADGSVGV